MNEEEEYHEDLKKKNYFQTKERRRTSIMKTWKITFKLRKDVLENYFQTKEKSSIIKTWKNIQNEGKTSHKRKRRTSIMKTHKINL